MNDVLRSCWEMCQVAWRHHRLKLVIAVTLTVLAGLAWPLLAVALRSGTRAVIAGDVGAAAAAGVWAGVGVVGVLVLRHFAFVPYTEIAEAAVVSLESELIHLANGSVGLEQHDRSEYADRVAVLQRELSRLTEGLGGLLAMLRLAISLGLSGWLLVDVSPWLLLLPAAAIPPMLAGDRAQRLLEQAKDTGASAVRQAWHVFDLATGAGPGKEIRLLRLRDELLARHAGRWAESGRLLDAAEIRSSLVVAAGQLVFGAAYVLAVLLVVRGAVEGRETVGDIVLVITLAAQLNVQINSLAEQLRALRGVAYGFTRLRWLRKLVADQASRPGTAEMPARLRSGIALHDVSFAYPDTDRPVLEGLDLVLPAGAVVALVGENGAGKSTLVKLLARFYEPTTGTITVDGVDLSELPLDRWREHTSACFQDFVKFELTARHVVGIGDLARRDDEATVRGAVARAGAQTVVGALADGLDTQLGKSWTEGAELSGGQWQRLALGRAMMRDAPLLLILDEPTAALDAHAEHELLERYSDHARRFCRLTGSITLLVSHRFSTVRTADLILVLADGRVTEAGSHDSLMAGHGLYRELYTLQASAFS